MSAPPGWHLLMAWRDARAHWRRLLAFVSTIVAGVAALVAITSFAGNLERAVESEAKVLLGADMEIYGRQPFADEAESLFVEVGGVTARQVAFGSMAYFPASGSSRLVAVRAISPGYPFYGRLETEPPEAGAGFPQPAVALVDHNLMLQFGADVGDDVRIGERRYRIAGRLRRIPGEVPNASLIGPRVFIPLESLASTGLLGPGSRARYSVFFRLSREPGEVAALAERIRPELRRLRLEVETVQYRRESLGDALDGLYEFLVLAGLAALLLGSLGIASSIHLHVRAKLDTVAVLRCLGAPPAAPVWIFCAQAAAMGCAGALVGAALGVVAQALLPLALSPFLPVTVPFGIAPLPVAQGILAGLAVSLAFSLIPLVTLRRVSPLRALRAFVSRRAPGRRDPLRWTVLAVVGAAVLGVAMVQTGSVTIGGGIAAGLGATLALLAATAAAMRAVAHRLVGVGWPFAVRQGVANLYRPDNQTLVVMLSLGFGVFLVGSLVLVQAALLGSIDDFSTRTDANLVLFDVQTDQVDPVRQMIVERDLEIVQHTAVVPMRLAEVGGRRVEEIPDDEISPWALRRVYNSTYRSELVETETVVDGDWIGAFDGSLDETVPVSLEDDIARRLRLEVGDDLVIDVQGLPIRARVASLRRIDWEQVRPNFLIVFPDGVLEEAPQQHVLVTDAPTAERSADLQRAVVERFANVSIMDLAMVLATIDTVLDQVAFALRFLTLFSFVAALTVLAVSVATSRYRRLRESVLLRTLGASRGQITMVGLSEYASLGALAALTGTLLAAAAAWPLTRYVFEVPFVLPTTSLLGLVAGATLVVVVVGLATGGRVLRERPIEVLREAG